MAYTELFTKIHHLRGVDTPCHKCQGLGVIWYGNGSTWRGGAGACTCTRDVCDYCWGTGDEHRHGVDLRAERDKLESAHALAVAEYLYQRTGMWLGKYTIPGIEVLCVELDSMGRPTRRKPRPGGFDEACQVLSEILRSGIKEYERRQNGE